MPFFRTLRSWSAFVLLGLAAVGSIMALCAAAVLDRGPSGGARGSIFSVAITALDPFVWTCARNSLIAAGASALGSMVVGVVVGRLVGDWRYPARPVLLAAMTASAVAHPAILALGLSILFDTDGRIRGAWRFVPAEWGWYLWVWSALVQGGAVSAFACLAAQGGSTPRGATRPAWREGRAAGPGES
jgi:ABC-type Fe3+ transport system permease subunit